MRNDAFVHGRRCSTSDQADYGMLKRGERHTAKEACACSSRLAAIVTRQFLD
jgi:hypothetical protein